MSKKSVLFLAVFFGKSTQFCSSHFCSNVSLLVRGKKKVFVCVFVSFAVMPRKGWTVWTVWKFRKGGTKCCVGYDNRLSVGQWLLVVNRL